MKCVADLEEYDPVGQKGLQARTFAKTAKFEPVPFFAHCSVIGHDLRRQTSRSCGPNVRYNENSMADDKTYKAEYQGSGTFLISKPKRKKGKLRQSRLKGTVRGARK